MKIISFMVGSLLLVTFPSMASELQSVLVSTAQMQRSNISSSLQCYGSVHFDERNAAAIEFPRDGTIRRFYVNVGQIVEIGDRLVEFETAPSETLTYQRALRAEAYAKKVEERWKTLLDQKAATASEFDTVHKQWADALDALKAERDRGTQKDHKKVRADFNGIVTSINYKQGDLVRAGTAILQLSREGLLLASLGVEPEDIHSVKLGMNVRISSVFDRTHTLEGKVIAIYGVIDPKTRLINVVASVGGAAWKYFIPGMQVTGEIVLDSGPAWVVPRQSVLSDDHGGYLFQVVRGHAHLVRVTVTGGTDQTTAIQGDFDPSLPVVTTGNYELRDGMSVREDGR